MKPSNILVNKTLSDTHWRVQLVCKKCQTQFFRTTSGKESGPEPFDRLRIVMTFWTILGVTEILGSLRLVLDGKTGKKIHQSSILELLEKFSTNKFCLLDAENNTSGLLNGGGIADLPLLRTLFTICQKFQEPSFWAVLDSYFIRIHTFDSFKNSFARTSSLSEFCFRFRRFILLLQTKRFDLILMMRDIYINSNMNPLKNSLAAAEARYPPMEHLLDDHQDLPISMRMVISYVMKRGIPLWICEKVNGNWENNINSNFPMEGKQLQNKYWCQKREIHSKE